MNDESVRELVALIVAAFAGGDDLAQNALADRCLEYGLDAEADAIRQACPGWIVTVRSPIHNRHKRKTLCARTETEARRIAAAAVIEEFRLTYEDLLDGSADIADGSADIADGSADIADKWVRLRLLYERKCWGRVLFEAADWDVGICPSSFRPPEPLPVAAV